MAELQYFKKGSFELKSMDTANDNVAFEIPEASAEKAADGDITVDMNSAGGDAREMNGKSRGENSYEERINIGSGVDGIDIPDNGCARGIRKIQSVAGKILKKNKRSLKITLYLTLLLLYCAYMCYALSYSFDGALALLVMTIFVVLCIVYAKIRDRFGESFSELCRPLVRFCDRRWNIIRWVSGILILALIILWIIFDTWKRPANMMSLVGLICIIIFCFLFSKHPDKIRWRPVVWGLVLQICLALLILRTKWGFEAFRFLGEEVSKFLDYTEAGSTFVFGELWVNHFFAFKVLPIILFLGSTIACLYHIRVIQLVIEKLAWLLQFTMHTSASESLAAAASIFLSMSEAPLLIAPYISSMSVSELHAVATSGYATIAGSVIGAAIAFGLSPSYLITASVMSAPAALALSKMFYPEIEKLPSAELKTAKINFTKYQNIIDAVATGAMAAVPIAVNVAANCIVFLGLVEFMNAFLSWVGGMVGYPVLSFELICAWVFMPVAYLMGVEWKDCFVVGELIGMKIVTSVLVSYRKMAILLENRELGLEPTLSPRSEVIATYALCGLSHLTGIGLTIGALIGISPDRAKDISSIVVRAMICGNAANFMTACIAGILYEDPLVTVISNTTDITFITDHLTTTSY